MSGIVGGSNNRGSGLIANLGTDGQILTSAGLGLRQVFEAAAAAGANTDLGNLSDTGKQQTARAWVYFNGTGTVAINDSYNVSSITDQGTGYYKVNYASSIGNTNNAPLVSAGHADVNWGIPLYAGTNGTQSADAINADSFGFVTKNTSAGNEDGPDCCAIIFGD